MYPDMSFGTLAIIRFFPSLFSKIRPGARNGLSKHLISFKIALRGKGNNQKTIRHAKTFHERTASAT